MLISYYANKKSSPRLLSWQPSLIFFNIPIESGSIIKPCTLKHFQVPYRSHKAGYWTSMNNRQKVLHSGVKLPFFHKPYDSVLTWYMFQCIQIVAAPLTLDSDGAISEESPSMIICTTCVVGGICRPQTEDWQLQGVVRDPFYDDTASLLKQSQDTWIVNNCLQDDMTSPKIVSKMTWPPPKFVSKMTWPPPPPEYCLHDDVTPLLFNRKISNYSVVISIKIWHLSYKSDIKYVNIQQLSPSWCVLHY